MDVTLKFSQIQDEELYLLDGGCLFCTAAAVVGGAATGAGTVLALASNPVGWAIAGGAAIGAGLGYLATR